MKRTMSLLLALCLTAALLLPASAAETDAVEVVRMLGIITGDEKGNLNLDQNVTRAEFCKMVVAASNFKDGAAGTGYSLFKDVKSPYWAAGYIKVCVDNGWFVGYSDGTFRPRNPITLEQAATVALRLLGYTQTDMPGVYPTAQLSKFDALNLHKGFSTRQGQNMTRRDCASLFANLVETKNKDGKYYAETIGYQVDAGGHLSYSTLVAADTVGPVTVQGALSAVVPFSLTGAQVFRNGTVSSSAEAKEYDICYYNTGMRTVWLYAKHVTGIFESASPSAAPTSVTVGGKSYDIETNRASYLLSTQGSYRKGDTITLLLGMNGKVADVCGASVTSGVYYGVVKSCGDETREDADGKTNVEKAIRVTCTDGEERMFYTGSSIYSAGTAVMVEYGADKTVTRLSHRSLSGRFSASSFGGKQLAGDVEIMDSNALGAAKHLSASRLSGSTLRTENVLYYELNARDEITRLILRDATGDVETYCLVLSTDIPKPVAVLDENGDPVLDENGNPKTEQEIRSGYSCLVNGEIKEYSFSDSILATQAGAARLVYDRDGKLKTMQNIKRLGALTISGDNVMSGNKAYPIVSQTQIYINRSGSYHTVSLDSIREGYSLTGYVDELGYPAGNAIRILVATAQ